MMEPNVVHHLDCFDLMARLPDASVDAIITDPPYGATRPSQRTDTPFVEILGNERVDGSWLRLAQHVLKPGGALYCFSHWSTVGEWDACIKSAGFSVRNHIVWDKRIHGLADTETCYAPRYELIVFATLGRHVLRGPRPADVVAIDKVFPGELTHPYEKPVELIERLIQSSTDDGDTILDPFAGSATTFIAALNTGRNCIGGDMTREYVDLGNRRIANWRRDSDIEVAPGVKQLGMFAAVGE